MTPDDPLAYTYTRPPAPAQERRPPTHVVVSRGAPKVGDTVEVYKLGPALPVASRRGAPPMTIPTMTENLMANTPAPEDEDQ